MRIDLLLSAVPTVDGTMTDMTFLTCRLSFSFTGVKKNYGFFFVLLLVVSRRRLKKGKLLSGQVILRVSLAEQENEIGWEG